MEDNEPNSEHPADIDDHPGDTEVAPVDAPGSRTIVSDGGVPVTLPRYKSDPKPLKIAIYQCTNQKCRDKRTNAPSRDRLRLFPGERVPVIVQCSTCNAGRGIPTEQEMYNAGKGSVLLGTYMIDMNDDENTPGIPITEEMAQRARTGS